MSSDVKSMTWRQQLETVGYVVVPGVVAREDCDAVLADIWQHTGAKPDEPASWYQLHTIGHTGMVEMYHYQSMWNNRQNPRVHAVFADIFATEKLWVSLDRTNLKPPVHPDHPAYNHKGFIHWDTNINNYPDIPFHVQGVLALTDTEEEMGGFQCVPSLYQELASWIERQPKDQPISRSPDVSDYEIVKVPLKAGDMVIWHVLMPHGNGHNVSNKPRLAQYITMFPEHYSHVESRQKRIDGWAKNMPPPQKAFPGDPRKIEEQRTTSATLSPLGRKLLGIDEW